MDFNTKILSDNNNILSNVGKINPLKIEDYIENGGYKSLEKALNMDQKEVIDTVSDSGLKGRGGAKFPTGRKWMFSYSAKADQKYMICNADEGEPGTVKDRVLMEGDPHKLIEGMAIAAYAIGATKGFIYVRGEYRKSIKTLKTAIKQAEEKNLLGKDILGSGFDLELSIAEGGGAYVCGEETALIESIEGKRGEPRMKPPYPPAEGLFGKPTIVNNVETLYNITSIIDKGADWFSSVGTTCFTGTKVFILSGDVNEPGVLETTMEHSIDEIINKYGKGIKDGKRFKFAQVGGSSGNIFTGDVTKKILTEETCREHCVGFGTCSIFVASEERSIVEHLLTIAEFFEHESCGKCTPCREGTHRIREIMEYFYEDEGNVSDLRLLEELIPVMQKSSFCGLGQACVNPFIDGITHFKNEILGN
ncbi:MAG: NADH-quinone oxidoreductase subunit NuoF [bacterium]